MTTKTSQPTAGIVLSTGLTAGRTSGGMEIQGVAWGGPTMAR